LFHLFVVLNNNSFLCQTTEKNTLRVLVLNFLPICAAKGTANSFGYFVKNGFALRAMSGAI
jgi:hypothetical protein